MHASQLLCALSLHVVRKVTRCFWFAARSTASTLSDSLQVQDAPLPRLGDALNGRVPWYGDAQPAPQVRTLPIVQLRHNVDSGRSGGLWRSVLRSVFCCCISECGQGQVCRKRHGDGRRTISVMNSAAGWKTSLCGMVSAVAHVCMQFPLPSSRLRGFCSRSMTSHTSNGGHAHAAVSLCKLVLIVKGICSVP
jgi:hypothetical protein